MDLTAYNEGHFDRLEPVAIAERLATLLACQAHAQLDLAAGPQAWRDAVARWLPAQHDLPT